MWTFSILFCVNSINHLSLCPKLIIQSQHTDATLICNMWGKSLATIGYHKYSITISSLIWNLTQNFSYLSMRLYYWWAIMRVCTGYQNEAVSAFSWSASSPASYEFDLNNTQMPSVISSIIQTHPCKHRRTSLTWANTPMQILSRKQIVCVGKCAF